MAQGLQLCGRRPLAAGHLQPEAWPHGHRSHPPSHMAVPSPAPLRRSYPQLWAPALRKHEPGLGYLTKATNSPIADMGVQPTSCSGQQGICPQSLHGSALRKKLHMAKWRYEMVKIYGFGVLSRLLWWFRVGSEPKPLITRRDLGGIWNLDPLLKSPSDSSLATDMVFYGFISIPEGYFHACLAADRGGGDLYMIYIQGNAYITTSLFP